MGKEPSKNRKTAKWYNSPLNSRIRDLLKYNNIKPDDFANALGVSAEAVRLWCAGYARPDIDKLLFIAYYFKVSVNYLLGQTDSQSTDADIQAIGDYTGLNDSAIHVLHELNDMKNDNVYTKSGMDFINTFLTYKNIEDLIIQVGLYIQSIKYTTYLEKDNSHIDFYSYRIKEPIGDSQKEKNENQSIYISWIKEKNEVQRLRLFNASELFMNLLKEYGEAEKNNFDFDEYIKNIDKDQALMWEIQTDEKH